MSDGGSEDRPKKIKKPRVTGKLTSGTLGIFGAAAGEDIPIADIESGNAASNTGAIALYTSTGTDYGVREDVALRGQFTYTFGVEGTWNGSGDLDRVDECVADIIVQGRRM